MQKQDILLLYAYNDWANERILNATAQVSSIKFTAPAPVSHGSLRGTLVHTLSAEWIWRQRCQLSVSPISLLVETEFSTLAELRQRWQLETIARQNYLNGLTDDALQQIMRYTNTKGQTFENRLWHLLVHVVNHGTQFRGEAAVLLTQYGQSPGDLDLIAFVRERSLL